MNQPSGGLDLVIAGSNLTRSVVEIDARKSPTFIPCGRFRGQCLSMQGVWTTGLEHIDAKLKARGQLARFIKAVEAQDQRTVAKLLNKVREPDDGTIAGLYLSRPELLDRLKRLL